MALSKPLLFAYTEVGNGGDYMYYYGMPQGGCCPNQNFGYCCGNNNKSGYGYALILVLFILLVIIGASAWF